MNDLQVNGETGRYGPGQGLEARGCGRSEAGGADPPSRGRAGRGSEKVPVPGSIHPRRTEVSRGPARGLPEQLHSQPVRSFVIYYTRSKESTLDFMVGMQPTWAAQKQTRKSRLRTGQEEKRERVTLPLPVPPK